MHTVAEARTAWEAGQVRPYLVSAWLDYRGFYGPGVDQALGVPEPSVDLWEAGQLYPTWEQFQALGTLCGVPLRLFTSADPRPPRVWVCGSAALRHLPPPVTRWTPAALAAAGLGSWQPEDGTLF